MFRVSKKIQESQAHECRGFPKNEQNMHSTKEYEDSIGLFTLIRTQIFKKGTIMRWRKAYSFLKWALVSAQNILFVDD